mmetsp:Transcript_45846/g.51297  ORF Transcript_45846/g.51297 Transcript_45846/m.51297 type:complete len:165 (-) Transcript_45846:28-522(-)
MGCEQSRSLAVDDDDSPQNNPDWYLGGGGTGARARRKKATTRTLAVENDSYMNPDWYAGGGGTGTGTGTSTGTRARRKKATTPTRTKRMNDKRVASHDSECMTCPTNDRDFNNYPIAMAIPIPTSASAVVVPTTPHTTSLYQEKCRQLEQADHANEMDILLGLA